jgi:ABC-type oligopeptide transport system substrate-binding subunit/DNA-binding SARP family transcriptional activator
MSRLTLYLLGSPQIELDGKPVEISRRKAVALLAYLAVTGQAHSRDTLATLLWPDYDQSRARGALRRTLSTLNTALNDIWLEADRATIELKRNANLLVDVEQFRHYLTECPPVIQTRPETCSHCISRLTRAAALYRDDFLAGFTLRDSPGFDEWQFFQAENLRRELAGGLKTLVDCYTLQGESESALTYARRWLELDPLHEPAHRRLMMLYTQTDQRAAALRQYQECVRILAEELNVAPSAETTALYEHIRLSRGAEKQGRGGAGRKLENVSSAPLYPRSAGPSFVDEEDLRSREAETSVFVGREPELAQLHSYLEGVLAGRGQVAFITGEAGSGKTALVEEFARRAQAVFEDLVVAGGNGNAYTGHGDPYLPFREILNLLVDEVEGRWGQGIISAQNVKRLQVLRAQSFQTLLKIGPDLIDTFISISALTGSAASPDMLKRLNRQQGTGNSTARVAQSDLFEQYTNVLLTLARQRPLLLVIDDAQWADVASINLMFHLGRKLSGSRILLLVTYRPDDIALGRSVTPQPGSIYLAASSPVTEYGERHPLEAVINELHRIYGNIQVDLDRKMSQDFVEALIDTQPNQLGPEFRTALYRQTGGHPLFTVELLRDMQERENIVRDDQGRWIEGTTLNWPALPARIEAVIKERIDRLPAELRDLLAVASVEGEVFTAQVVAQIQGLGERPLLRHLSQELVARHRLIQAQGEIQVGFRFLSRYQFTHTLFQQYLYHTLSAGEQRLIHGEIAAVLEALYQDQTDLITVQLARHYAGAGQSEQAVDYLLKAGDRARSLYAHQQASEFYEQALTFLRAQGAYERAARTLMKLGLTHHLAFNFPQARRAYAEGFSLWQRAGAHRPSILPPAPHALRVSKAKPISLDPAKAADSTSFALINQLFSGLVELNTDLDVVPGLAQSWEVLEGGSKYIFQLRDNICWSDGLPVTTLDFIFAWQRLLHPASEPTNASYLYDIKGARAYHQGEMSDPDQVGVQALDERTLIVELEGPTSYFPQLLTQGMFFPVPRHVVLAHSDRWTDSTHIVTNGPFKLVSWQPGQLMRLERNPDYRGPFSGNIRQVDVFLDVSHAEGLKMYEAERLDIAAVWPGPTPEAQRILQSYSEEYLSIPYLNTNYLGFNTRQAPFDDVRVRRALALAVDKERLASVILAGYQFPALGGFVPPGMPGHSPDVGLPYNPEQARQLLAEAGYPDGRGFPQVDFVIDHEHKIIAEFVSLQWRENLGLDLEWHSVEWSVLFDQVKRRSPDMFTIGWAADYPDPDNFLRVSYHSRSIQWQNRGYVELVEKARRITNQTERMQLYQAADKILIEEVALLPLMYSRQNLLIKPWVTKYPTSAINVYFWKDVVIEPH